MTITVGWSTDQVITINKVDMVLTQSTPVEVYELNVNTFFTTLKDLERTEEGMPWPDTQSNNSPVTLGGITYARVLEIIPPYTITFEDGQYAVDLVGANNNILDRTNPNQVSVRSNNSAGLVGTKQIEDQSFGDERVWIDVDAGQAGTTFPIGTPGTPVNNLADAQTIISNRTLPKRLHVRGTLPIGATDNIDAYDILGVGPLLTTLTFTSGASNANTRINGATISGDMSGEATIVDATLGTITGLQGDIVESGLSTTVTLAGNVRFVRCHSDVAGSGKPVVDCNSVSSLSVEARGYHGGLEFTNFNQSGNVSSFDGDSIRLLLASTCTAGTIVVGGIGELTDNSVGATVNSASFNPSALSATESTQIDEIHKRLDLDGDQTYADDGSTISNPDFTLTKSDNGDGTFDINRS
jgi:hypothetical protein